MATMRQRPQAQARAPRLRSRQRQVVQAFQASDVPPNVLEARAWIAAWKARCVGHATATPTPQAAPAAQPVDASAEDAPIHSVPAVVPANVAEARAWIAAWKARAVPSNATKPTHLAVETPSNVLEVRAWIAAWKNRSSLEAAIAATPSSTVSAEFDGASDPEPSLPQQPAAQPALAPLVAADGTITFTKALLDSCSYEDLVKALRSKVDGTV